MKMFLRPATMFIIVFAITGISGCMKSNPGNSSTPPAADEKPTPTPVGTVVGDAVTKNIGTGGGNITSADGTVELILPSGALQSSTDISIQAIVNNAPNGRGNAYRLMPEGMKFLQPVILKFHFTDDDLAETISGLMGIAFQDSVGIWYRVNHIDNDEANKVISASISHFSDWSRFDVMLISPINTSLRVDKSVGLEVINVNAGNDEEDLAPLFKKTFPVKWSVNGILNGSSAVGTIGEGSTSVTYKAPSKIPGENPVAISALVPFNTKYQGNTFNSLQLVSHITIIDGEKYLLEMRITETTPPFKYTDSVSMLVVINSNDQVVVSDIKNFAPKTTPQTARQGDCTATVLPDAIGETNVSDANGTISGSVGDSTRDLFLTINNSGAMSPRFTQVCDGSDPETNDARAFEGLPTQAFFKLVSGQKVYTVDTGEEFDRLTLLDQ